MRPQGSAEQLESRRRMAVRLLDAGHESSEVAELVEATVRSVQRWRVAADLAAVPQSGRPPKLTDGQTAQVVSWLARSATAFGFATERWTAPRVAELIEARLSVAMHPRYLNRWLTRHGDFTPQIPQRRPAERDEAAVERWRRHEWPRIKKTPRMPARPWRSPTRRVSCCSRWSERRWPRAARRRS